MGFKPPDDCNLAYGDLVYTHRQLLSASLHGFQNSPGNFPDSRDDVKVEEWMSGHQVSLVFHQTAGPSSTLTGVLWLSAANSRAW